MLAYFFVLVRILVAEQQRHDAGVVETLEDLDLAVLVPRVIGDDLEGHLSFFAFPSGLCYSSLTKKTVPNVPFPSSLSI